MKLPPARNKRKQARNNTKGNAHDEEKVIKRKGKV